MKRITHSVTALLFAGTMHAQEFNFQADVAPIEKSGYHEIAISPDIISRSRRGLNDLRLFDESGDQVPYFIRTDDAVTYTGRFIPFTIAKNQIIPDEYTEIIIEQETGSTLDEIHLEVANASVSKTVEITGSDDQEQWYAVKRDHVSLRPRSDGKTSTLSVVDLPLSSHRYFRITIADSLNAPLKILDLGHQGREQRIGRFDEASGYQILTRDDQGKTEIRLCSEFPLLYDRIRFSADSAERFHREVDIYSIETPEQTRRQRRKGIVPDGKSLLTSAHIRSGDLNAFDLAGAYSDTLLVVIENGDDPPLASLDVHVENRRRSLIAELDSGKSYVLKTGNDDIRSPQYDLHRFVNEETPIESTIDHDAVVDLRQDKTTLDGIGRNWMWLAIGALTLFMLYMISGMLKDQKGNGIPEDR